MTNFIKIASLLGVFAIVVFAFSVSTPKAFALGSGSDGGCCGGGSSYSQSSYYNQGSYYSQSSYHVDAPKPVCTITATPATIVSGGTSKLTWTSTNATTDGSIDQGVGAVNPQNAAGFRNVSPVGTTVYTMTVRNTDGVTATCKTTVTVSTPTPAPTCDSFTGSPTSLPYGGGTVTLKWNTTNATAVSISDIGSVNLNNTVGRQVAVTASKTFVLTATNVTGSVNCSVPVTVATNSGLSCDYFNVDKSVVDRGESFTLSWGTTNADSVSISPSIGSVSVDGTHTTSVSNDTTYTLTASKGSETITCTRPVSIRTNTYSQGSYSSGGNSSSPECDIDASDESITSGQEIKLTWNTSRTEDITIKDSFGNEILSTDDLDDDEKDDFLDGEIKVRPLKDTTYYLKAENGSRNRTCSVKVNVDGGVIVTEIRNQPLVAGIALTQVPYTGFDAGPTLTLVFYALLGLWALFIAYTLVLKKKVS